MDFRSLPPAEIDSNAISALVEFIRWLSLRGYYVCEFYIRDEDREPIMVPVDMTQVEALEEFFKNRKHVLNVYDGAVDLPSSSELFKLFVSKWESENKRPYPADKDSEDNDETEPEPGPEEEEEFDSEEYI